MNIILESLLKWFAPILVFTSDEVFSLINKILHEKIDLVVSIVKKKPRKNTLTEVNTKVDCIIEQLDKKRKLKPKEGEK